MYVPDFMSGMFLPQVPLYLAGKYLIRVGGTGNSLPQEHLDLVTEPEGELSFVEKAYVSPLPVRAEMR